MNRRHRAVLGMSLLAWWGACLAHDTAPAPIRLQIEPQPIGAALNEFARQSGLQVFLSSEDGTGIISPRISGTFTPQAALALLLSNTGLSFEYLNERTVAVRSAKRDEASPLKTTQEGEAEPGVSAKARLAHFYLAQGQDSAAEPASTQQSADRGERTVERLEEILVTGSRLRQPASEGPHEVKVYTKEQIERSGQSTLAGFLGTLPEVSRTLRENNADTSAGISPGQATVALRGLPVGTTLVLINGRRATVSGHNNNAQQFFDLNTIPASAVERIDVVPSGSSAIYGSDALAGVVNIILKKDMRGGEVNVQYGAASGTDEKSASLGWGWQAERGGFSLIGTYFSQGELDVSERAITRNLDHSAIGGVDRRAPYCVPGSVRSIDNSNLPGVGAPFAAIAPGAIGTPTLDDFAGGQTNLCSNYRFGLPFSIFGESDRLGAFASSHFKLSSSVELFTELLASRNRSTVDYGGRPLFGQLVPASNAFNPFGQDVLVDYYVDDVRNPNFTEVETKFLQPLLGARGAFSDNWDWEVTAAISRERTSRADNNDVDFAALDAALASSDPATALNLLASGPPASDQIVDSLFDDEHHRYSRRMKVANAFVRGPLFSVPAGNVQAVIGGEYSEDDLLFDVADPLLAEPLRGSRYNSALFAELRLPIVADNATRREILTLSGAARYDRTNTFGSETTPQFGVEWRPGEAWLIRGSYSEAYRAPGLYTTSLPQFSLGNIIPIVDLERGGELVFPDVNFGGNPDLKTETGASKTLGVRWESQRFPGLTLSSSWWSVTQEQRISAISITTIVEVLSIDSDLLPGVFIRGPDENGMPGPLETLNIIFVNFGSLSASGVDAEFSHRINTRLGELSTNLSVSRTLDYDTQLVPGTPVQSQLSQADQTGWAPRWKGSTSFGWSRNSYSLQLSGRYVSSYADYKDIEAHFIFLPEREIGDSWLWDLSARFELGELFANNKAMAGANLSIGALNVFDALPAYSRRFFDYSGYDPDQYDIRGRFIYANLAFKW